MSAKRIDELLNDAEELRANGQYKQAIELYRDALRESEQLFGGDSEQVVRPLIALSRAIAGRSSDLSNEADEIVRRAKLTALSQFGPSDIRTSRTLYQLSFVLQILSHTEDILQYLFDALHIASAASEVEDELWILRALTNNLLLEHRYSDALPYCVQLLRIEETRGDRSPAMVAHYQVGLCLLRLRRGQSAIPHLERAKELRSQLSPRTAPDKVVEELDGLLLEARAERS